MRSITLLALGLAGCAAPPLTLVPSGHVVVQDGRAYPVSIAQSAGGTSQDARMAVRVDGGYLPCGSNCAVAFNHYLIAPDTDVLLPLGLGRN